MWFFGFSTSHPRNLWIIGAILLVIILTIILRKVALYLESQQNKYSESEKRDGEQEISVWCSAVVRTYALEELKEATRDFRIRIGIGATSFVYLAELGDGRYGAVKRVMEERGGSKKMFLDEVSVLLRISHPNLVGLIGFCLDKGEQLMLLEYVPNKSLFDKMHTHPGQSSGILTWSNRLTIALDIARALHYLHSHADPPIIHRDVKSSNILLIDNHHAKLADFGLCQLGHTRPDPKSPSPVKGSFGYVDVNYVKTGHVSPKSDVYSFGVVLVELITGLRSVQGYTTLAEWSEEFRRSEDVEVRVRMLDPKLNGDVDLEQFRVLVDLANWALLENAESRPDMSIVVDRILGCMEPQVQPHLPV